MNHAGTVLAVTGEQGSVMLLDLGTKKIRSLASHGGLASCVAWRSWLHPFSDQLLTGGADMCLKMHDIVKGEVVKIFNVRSLEASNIQHINPPFVHALDVSYDGMNMAVGAGDGILRLYDLMAEEGSPRVFSRLRHRRSITCVTFPLVTQAISKVLISMS